jgi:acetyl esterase/lipase
MLKAASLFLLVCASAFAQISATATWAVQSQNHYNIRANITYGTYNNVENKLDAYLRRDAQGPQPALIFIHGGGWILGTKEASMMSIVPWLEMGWNVFNVEYRMAKVSLAPAAVEDCLCALRFIADHAKEYNVDLARIVVMGESAGGHLSLTTGMIPESVGLDRQCPGGAGAGVFTGPGNKKLPKVAAILDWYGISDLNDMLSGPNERAYATEWFGSLPNAQEIAKKVSPLTYVRRDIPPILIIHGDADPIVPYSQATRLRDALSGAGASFDMYTVKGGGHGNYSAVERVKIYEKIHEFLTKYKVM